MGETLSAVWEQVSALLADGVSVIPVRDKEQDGKPAKSPYALWKQYQSKIIEEQELWHQMEHYNTTAVAMICGAVSGNLEAIDIDVKNWAGIDARLSGAIRDIYPNLFERLRIHKTPSGGFHLIYRVSETVPGNQKLATASDSTQAGIETRGEGGYIVAPPSLGYQVYRDRPIPLFTKEERDGIIGIAKSLNEKIKVLPPPSVPKAENHYYDTNPFVDYNLSSAAESVLTDHGWSHTGGTRTHDYFTRPGKTAGISASFNHETRIYYVFTTSTGLEAERGYTPSTLLSLLQFGGDKKGTYKYLVDQGFGRITPKVETSLVRARVLSGDPLPANASEGAKVIYLESAAKLKQTYPGGVYWTQENPDGAVMINRERLYGVAAWLGFRSYQSAVVQIGGYLCRSVTERHFYDSLKGYIVEEDPDFLETIHNSLEAFLQRSGEFTMTRITLLDLTQFLISTKYISYKFFRNCYLEITKEGMITHDYAALDNRLIWDRQLQDRDFTLEEGLALSDSLYYQFLQLAIGISPYLWQLLGYLAHEFKDETMGYIVVLVEQCSDPKQGGGTGKNVFSSLLGHTTSYKNIPGTQMQFNEKFLQAWNFERVLSISDVPKKFNFLFLKELSTGSGILKKLFKDELAISSHQMPKLVVSTNYSYEVADGGLRRRIRALEFTNFFTRAGGVKVHFGKMFPYDWDAKEWHAFDNIIAMAIQQYLRNPEPEAIELTEDGWMKQYDQTHMPLTRIFIQEHWEMWMRIQFISNAQFKIDYEAFCIGNNVGYGFRLTSYGMNLAIRDWCQHMKVYYDPDYHKRENSTIMRGRLFKAEDLPF